MRKPKKEDLYAVEFSDSAQAILNSAFSSTDPRDALRQLTRILKGKAILRCEIIEYSCSSGEPIRYGWKPFEKWDRNLWFDILGNYPSLDKNMPLYKSLHRFLPVGKTIIIKSGSDKFVVRHVPSKSEGDWQDGGTVPNHLEFTKAE